MLSNNPKQNHKKIIIIICSAVLAAVILVTSSIIVTVQIMNQSQKNAISNAKSSMIEIPSFASDTESELPSSEYIEETTEDVEASLFKKLAGRQLVQGFSHGSYTISINKDKSFSFVFKHSVYHNEQSRLTKFYVLTGSFAAVRKLNDFTYSLHIKDVIDTSKDTDLSTIGVGALSEIVDSNNYNVGFRSGSEVILYCPEAPLNQIPSSLTDTAGKMRITPNGNYLGYYCLVDSKGMRYYSKDY